MLLNSVFLAKRNCTLYNSRSGYFFCSCSRSQCTVVAKETMLHRLSFSLCILQYVYTVYGGAHGVWGMRIYWCCATTVRMTVWCTVYCMMYDQSTVLSITSMYYWITGRSTVLYLQLIEYLINFIVLARSFFSICTYVQYVKYERNTVSSVLYLSLKYSTYCTVVVQK
jgi:hypothetical protein